MAVRQTYTAFVDALEAITVNGVERSFLQGPPASLKDTDLPAKWVQFPRGNEMALVFGEQGGLQTSMGADIVIAVVSTEQSLQGANFVNTVTMMDNLMTALMALGNCDVRAKWRVNIRQTVVTVAGFEYWAVVCTVEV